MRTRPVTQGMVTALLLTLTAALGVGTSAGATAEDPRAKVSTPAAKQALADARAALSGRSGPSRDLTMDLRDLALERDDLTGADRKAADAILARPTSPDHDDYYGLGVDVEEQCGDLVCLHWTEEQGNDNAATPAYAAQTLATVNDIAQQYVDAGYRAPKSDGALGGTPLPDVYLAEISDYAYGYCTTDAPIVEGVYAYWAYCVLDDDYAEFGSANTPLDFMRVTAAHEYFHAVQFAYDLFEDRWLMEGSATWVEDEVYDHVDDSLNYLPAGQLGDPAAQPSGHGPRIPLDETNSSGLSMYGNWVFFRQLTESLPQEAGGMPVLMRRIWEHADSTHGEAADQYSLQAVVSALDQAGVSFRDAYAGFAAANRQPSMSYDEGAANAYPTPGLAMDAVTLTPRRPRTTWGSLEQDHLTNDTIRFKPGKPMRQSGWRLRVQVDMAPTDRGSVAVLTVFPKSGAADIVDIPLDGQGDGSAKVPFAWPDVKHVELTMVNASARTSCWSSQGGPTYSCYGSPLDDDLTARFRGVAAR